MEQALIIVQGLAYSALVITLLSNRLSRGRKSAASILAASIALAMLHGILTFAIPSGWMTTWLAFWVPGHIITPLVLLWWQRRRIGGG